MLLVLISGAVAGMVHVLAGPDHLTAVAPIAIGQGRRGWLSGWTWGIGHATGVICVAVAAVLLRSWISPIDALSNWGERAVGVALMGVGLWTLRRTRAIGDDAHVHGALEHGHLHVQRGPGWFQQLGHAHASFYLGILHGIAGSSHFFGVLPALALPSAAASLAYIAAFGTGTVSAMTCFAAAVGLVGAKFSQASRRALTVASSVAALLVGGFWLFG